MSTARRALTLALLAWVAIEIHELGHLAAYALSGHPARMGFQRVDPLGPVPEGVRLFALAAGPATSLLAAVACLVVARRRGTFGWAAAAFANASIRLFPGAMDLLRALRGGRPFSDEGEIALALAGGQAGRVALLLLMLAPGVVLTVLAVRAFRFPRRPALYASACYALTFVVGVAAVLADDLLKAAGR